MNLCKGGVSLQGDWMAVTHVANTSDALAFWRVYVTGPDVPMEWMERLVVIKRGMHMQTRTEDGVEVYFFRKGDVIALEKE